MDKWEYIDRYCELLNQANEKEAKLEAVVQNWLMVIQKCLLKF